MSEVTDLIAAIVAIAKDPKAWEKRLGDADDIAKQLAEARKEKKAADEAAKAAAADLEMREAIATKKLNDANKLMAAYDEAKHQAALKLAS